MALRMPSQLGWPWECFKFPDDPFCAVLDECALQDGWHRGRPCAGGCDEAAKQTVAGRVPSILQSILIKNGA